MAFDPATYELLGAFFLGRERDNPARPVLYNSRDLTTHAVCVGMTGSGKTGLCVALLEEALIDNIPAIVIDPKGDIGNLKLTFPNLAPDDFAPWMEDPSGAPAEAAKWRDGLASWGQSPARVQRLRDAGAVTIFTPGSTAGRPVSILGSLRAPNQATIADAELFADRVSSTVSSLLGLLGNASPDPMQDPEHVFLSNLLSHVWRAGGDLDLAGLIGAIQRPPFDRVGVMALDDVFGPKQRAALAMRCNNLLAAPAFAPWLQGDDLDVGQLLFDNGRPRVSVFSIAHLNDAERMFFVSLLVGRVLDWTRQQSGTSSLRALLYMDEVFGFLPPVANPPSKQPLLTMLKQARAFGVGVVLATQNPVDLDYKALSNTGTWFIGRLQTERDVARVVDGLLGADDGLDRATVERTIAGLGSREFLLHNVREEPVTMQTRWVLSYLRGPLTREEIRKLEAPPVAPQPVAPQPVAPVAPTPAPVAEPAPEARQQGKHLRLNLPSSGEQLIWRPMVYGAGAVTADGLVTRFGRIRGLSDGTMFDWAEASEVQLDPAHLLDDGPDGAYLDVDPAALHPETWKRWGDELQQFAVAQMGTTTHSCKKLRLTQEPGESEAAFRQRVDHAIRERRDEAVDKLRERYARKVEAAQSKVDRARDVLEREQDQARAAKLDAAVNVGEALWGMFGGRKRSVTASRATRVMKEGRDVERASEKLDALRQEQVELQEEMENALTDESLKFGREDFPITTTQKRLRAQDVAIQFCQLVWVPYWQASDGQRRRAF